MRRKRWLLLVAVVLVVGLGYVAYSLFVHGGDDSLTVSELKSQAESIYDQQVSVTGKVALGSVNWDEKGKVIRFVLTDDRESLAIVYKGIVPDDFKPGADLVVKGKYRPDGVFEALSFSGSRSLCTFCH